jgi:hypothetical protein
MIISITKKELESLIEYQKFAVLNNPCIRCTRKTGLCTNECSDYYQYSTNRAKYRPSPELVENKSLMKYVELLVDIKCIEADIEVLVHKKVKKKSEMIQLAKQFNVEGET